MLVGVGNIGFDVICELDGGICEALESIARLLKWKPHNLNINA